MGGIASLVLNYNSESLGRNSISPHCLIARLTSPDIIKFRFDPTLGERLHECGPLGLGRLAKNKSWDLRGLLVANKFW